MDIPSGYHQVPLAEESRDLTTFLTLYGHYRFKRQSMGMKQAGDVFCQATDKIINAAREELEKTLGDRFGIFKSVNDVLMQASTCEELELVICLFQALYEAECEDQLQEVPVGHQHYLEGRQAEYQWDEIVFTPQDMKLQEVQNFKAPRTKKELQSFLGVMAMFHRWNPNICKFSMKLSKLNSKGVHF